jgi:hypothetical protein
MSDLSSGPSLGEVLQFWYHEMLLRNGLLVSAFNHSNLSPSPAMCEEEEKTLSTYRLQGNGFLPLCPLVWSPVMNQI